MKKDPPRFTQETREQYVAHIVNMLRKKATKGRRRRWKKNAWTWLFHALKIERKNMRWAGPVDVAVYAGYAQLMMKYLEAHPDRKHIELLQDWILSDLSILDLYREGMPDFMYTDEELYLLEEAVCLCVACLDRIDALCPDTA